MKAPFPALELGVFWLLCWTLKEVKIPAREGGIFWGRVLQVHAELGLPLHQVPEEWCSQGVRQGEGQGLRAGWVSAASCPRPRAPGFLLQQTLAIEAHTLKHHRMMSRDDAWKAHEGGVRRAL